MAQEQTVNCQIAGGEIPKSLCYEEQGTAACRGCMASTRRCPECSRAGNLADPKEGVCVSCLEKLGNKVGDANPRLEGGSIHAAIRNELLDLEEVGEGDFSQLESVFGENRGDEDPASILKPSALVENTNLLLALLCEHATENQNGVLVVTSPEAILRTRGRLLPHEVQQAMRTLIVSKLIERIDTGTVRVLAKEIPKLPGASDSSTAHVGRHISARHLSVAGTLPRENILVIKQPGQKDIVVPSIAEVYALFLERYRIVQDERILTGAVPLLQLHFKVGAPIAMRILERLQEEGLIKQRDEWRMVVLLVESTDDSSSALADAVLNRLQRSAARAKIRIRKGLVTLTLLQKALEALDEAIVQLNVVQERVGEETQSLKAHREDVRQAMLAYQEGRQDAEDALKISDLAGQALQKPATPAQE